MNHMVLAGCDIATVPVIGGGRRRRAASGASGRTWTKAEILDGLEADPAFTGAAASVAAYVLAADVVLVTYEITGPRPSLRSSVWVRDDSRWRLHFHQGTLRHAP